ncbi:6-bladed beta-propeller [Gracilimonas halophila]|uniref:6-bladed beta-propeller n=1 Tax=Gracilimonas halophila TaxID=1834464 RepID=A0ABW5JIR4_9BACT
MKKILSVFLFASLFYSCSKDGEVIHPRAEFIQSIEMMSNSVKIQDHENSSENILPVVPPELVYLGGGEVGTDDFIVEMGGVVMDDFGRIYVSVPKEYKIKVFDKNGDFLEDIGRGGRGPGEFEFLSDIDYHSEKDLLIVLDNKDIEIFKVTENEISHERTIYNEATMSTDLCVTNNKIIVNGYTVQETNSNTDGELPNLKISPPLQAYPLDQDTLLSSFGDPYYSEHGWGIFDGTLSKMKVQCNENSGIIIGMLDLYPYLAGYDAITFEKNWETGITGVNLQKFKETKTSAVDINLSPMRELNLSRHHVNTSFTSYQDKKALIQFNEFRISFSDASKLDKDMIEKEYSDKVTNISITIDHSTGKIDFLKSNYPILLNSILYKKNNSIILGPKIVPKDAGIVLAIYHY